MADFKVVVTDIRFPAFKEEEDVLAEIGAELVLTDCTTPEEVREACADADGVLANMAPVTAEVIEGMEKCKVIARYGVGVDNVDVAAATRKGIYVTNEPGYCAEEVSDHAMALLLSAARGILIRDRGVRSGKWNIEEAKPSFRIKGKTVGVVGFGAIAKGFCSKIAGFAPERICVFDPFVSAGDIESLGAVKVELDDLLAESDYISLHAPLNDKTRHMIDSAAFAKMKKKPLLVNTSRGGLIDQAAMIDALNQGQIRGAGLDVYETEPLEAESPLRKMDNVVLTDHCSFYGEEAVSDLKRRVAENAASVLTNGKPITSVNQI